MPSNALKIGDLLVIGNLGVCRIKGFYLKDISFEIVKPTYDKPEILREYAKGFSMNTGNVEYRLDSGSITRYLGDGIDRAIKRLTKTD